MGLPVTATSPESAAPPPRVALMRTSDGAVAPDPADSVELRRELSARFAEAIAQAQADREKGREPTPTSGTLPERPIPGSAVDHVLTEEEQGLAAETLRSLSFDFPLVHPRPLLCLLRGCQEDLNQIARLKDQPGTSESGGCLQQGWRPRYLRPSERVVGGLLFLQSQGKAQEPRGPPSASAPVDPHTGEGFRPRQEGPLAVAAAQKNAEEAGVSWGAGVGQGSGAPPVWKTAGAILQSMLLGMPAACLSLPQPLAAAQALCACLPPAPSNNIPPEPSPPEAERSALELQGQDGDGLSALEGRGGVTIEEVEAAGSESDWEPLEEEAEDRRNIESEIDSLQCSDADEAHADLPLEHQWRNAVPLLRDLLASAGPAAATARLEDTSAGASRGPALDPVSSLVQVVGNLRRVHRGVEGPAMAQVKDSEESEAEAVGPGPAAAAVESLSLLCCELLAEVLLGSPGEAGAKGAGAVGSSSSGSRISMEGVLRSILEQGKDAAEGKAHLLGLTTERGAQGRGEAELRRKLQAQDGWVTLVDVLGSLICRVSSTRGTAGSSGGKGATGATDAKGAKGAALSSGSTSAGGSARASPGSAGVQGTGTPADHVSPGARISSTEEEAGEAEEGEETGEQQAERERQRRTQALAEAALLAEQQGKVWRAAQALLPQLASFLEESLAQTRAKGAGKGLNGGAQQSSSSSSAELEKVLRLEFLCGGRLRSMHTVLLFFLSHTPNSAPKGAAGEVFLESGVLRGFLGVALAAASSSPKCTVLGAETLKDVHFVLFCYAAAFSKVCAFLTASRVFCEAALALGQTTNSSVEEQPGPSPSSAGGGLVDFSAVLRPLGVLWSLVLPAPGAAGKVAAQSAASLLAEQLKAATESVRNSLTTSSDSSSSSFSPGTEVASSTSSLSDVSGSNSSQGLEAPVQQLHVTLTLLEEAATLALPRTVASSTGRGAASKVQGDTSPLLLGLTHSEVHALATECQNVSRGMMCRTRVTLEDVEGQQGEVGSISSGAEGVRKTIALLSRVTAQLKWLCLVSEPVCQGTQGAPSKAQAARGKAD